MGNLQQAKSTCKEGSSQQVTWFLEWLADYAKYVAVWSTLDLYKYLLSLPRCQPVGHPLLGCQLYSYDKTQTTTATVTGTQYVWALSIGLPLVMSLRFCNKNVSIRSGIIHNSTTFWNKECYISLTADIFLGFFITTSIMNKYLAQSTTFYERETLWGLKSINETSGKAPCQIVHVLTFKKTRYKK